MSDVQADLTVRGEPGEAGFGDYVQLLKPRVMSLVVFTALVGVLVAPVGGPSGQQLLRLRKTAEGVVQEDLGAVSFVPLLAGTL